MKRVIAVVMVLLLVAAAAPVSAQGADGAGASAPGGGPGGNSSVAQVQNQSMVQNQSAVNATPAGQQLQEQQSLKNELQTRINERRQQLDEETAAMPASQQQVIANQNRVRLAVHTFLALGELDGGTGQNISAIAREYNSTIDATIRAEERIQSRNSVVRLLFGGDADAAAELAQLQAENQLRIQEMNRLIEECDCDEETKALLKEQLREMEQEQTRLQQLADQEQADRGLLGWLWK